MRLVQSQLPLCGGAVMLLAGRMKHTKTIKQKFADATTDHERTAALFASEQNADDELVDFLLSIARNSTAHDLTRIEAINGLGLCGSRVPLAVPRIVDALVQLANNDSDTDVQNYALMALGHNAGDVDPRRLLPSFESGRDSNSRHSALAVLRGQTHRPEVLEILRGLVTDADLGRAAKRMLAEAEGKTR